MRLLTWLFVGVVLISCLITIIRGEENVVVVVDENVTSKTVKSCVTTCSPGQENRGGSADFWSCDAGSGFGKVMKMCAPMWLIILIVLLCSLGAVLLAFCITRCVYKRRLDAEKRKRMESMAQLEGPKYKQFQPRGVSYYDPPSRSTESREKSVSMAKASIRSKSSLGKSKIGSPGGSKLSSGYRSPVDLKSKRSVLSVSKMASMSKRPSPAGSKRSGGGESGSGGWVAERPPSLTGRSVDEMYRNKKMGSKLMAPSTRTAIEIKTTRSVAKSSKSPKSTTKGIEGTGHDEEHWISLVMACDSVEEREIAEACWY